MKKMNKFKHTAALVAVFLSAFFFAGCDDFEGDQHIPSYLRVDGFTLVENPNINISQDSGFLSSDIRDVWVYVDNEFIGAFPLPCSVPILKKGQHRVDIRPGVLYNGMHDTREAYPFYTTAVKTIDLVEGEEVAFGDAKIMYNDTYAQFPGLYELFEGPYNNFMLPDTVNGQFVRMNVISNNDSVRYGNSCGAIYFDQEGRNKYISIDSVYCTNKNGTVLELDYHSNIPFEVGIYGRSSSQSAPRYVSAMRVTPSNEKGWQKMYILLNPVWKNLGYPEYYKFYFEAFNPDGKTNTFIHLDNIKIVHYPNQY